MNLTKVLTFVFLIVAVGIGYFLINSIISSVEEEKRIATIERRVIEKLQFIRDAEMAYQDAHGQYTSDWNKLINFIDTGKIFITQRREETVLLDYGAEETTITIDTLGSISVRDSIYNNPAYQKFDLSDLMYVPVTRAKFELFADKIQRSGVDVDVFEVKDPSPINPARRGENSVKGPLRVGSRTEVTTAGNWE
ncbi:hypothetical protein OKW21_005696 [Catalinimonas alkaloidigena]|uniref:hypothetical protein n=1 Tax=Catalinimonas alkaloidigena TaxID=1075417 RepID=UPI0024058A1F|nr:hypothetical protein [Catalinimonas alkaloidigena]MDF9800433.1 hypothetical protein [Catalinimonas alkaloidigena]